MAKKYRYEALTNGTLGKPPRGVRKGTIVELDEPIEAKWLHPLRSGEGVSKKVIPPMSGLKPIVEKQRPAPHPETGTHYGNQIEQLRKNEDAADGKDPAEPAGENTPAPADKPDATKTDGNKGGTGNQNVL